MAAKTAGTRPALTRCRPTALLTSIVCLFAVLSSVPLSAQEDPAIVVVPLDESHFDLHVFGDLDDLEMGWGSGVSSRIDSRTSGQGVFHGLK